MPVPAIKKRLLGPTSPPPPPCVFHPGHSQSSPSLPACLIPTNSPAPNPFTCRGIEPLSISHYPQGKAISKMVIKIKKDVKTPSNSSSRASSVIPIVVSRNQFDSSKTRAGINVKAGSGGEVKLRPCPWRQCREPHSQMNAGSCRYPGPIPCLALSSRLRFRYGPYDACLNK